MGMLEKIIAEQNLLPDGFHTISQMSVTAADGIFEQEFGQLCSELYGGRKSKRPGDSG